MDSILSTVLSIFSHNPIIILGIIAYVAFSIIRGKNTEESDEYDNYDNYGTSSQTWEDMEREYGISIERKVEEPSGQDLLYDKQGRYDSIPKVDETSFENRPKDEVATATEQDFEVLPKKGTSSSSSYTTNTPNTSDTSNTTRLGREAVTEAPLHERLAEFKRDKASKEGRVLVEKAGVTTAPTVTSTRTRKSNHALKEGMKWSIILGKPKALERRYR